MTKNKYLPLQKRHSYMFILSSLSVALMLTSFNLSAQSPDMTGDGPFTAEQAAAGLLAYRTHLSLIHI